MVLIRSILAFKTLIQKTYFTFFHSVSPKTAGLPVCYIFKGNYFEGEYPISGRFWPSNIIIGFLFVFPREE